MAGIFTSLFCAVHGQSGGEQRDMMEVDSDLHQLLQSTASIVHGAVHIQPVLATATAETLRPSVSDTVTSHVEVSVTGKSSLRLSCMWFSRYVACFGSQVREARVLIHDTPVGHFVCNNTPLDAPKCYPFGSSVCMEVVDRDALALEDAIMQDEPVGEVGWCSSLMGAFSFLITSVVSVSPSVTSTYACVCSRSRRFVSLDKNTRHGDCLWTHATLASG